MWHGPGLLTHSPGCAGGNRILLAGLCCCLFVFQAGRYATHQSKEWVRREFRKRERRKINGAKREERER